MLTPAERRARARGWLDSLSDRDWARLSALADQVTPNRWPARLDDLDAPGIAAGVLPPDMAGYTNGHRVGTLKGCALVVWPK